MKTYDEQLKEFKYLLLLAHKYEISDIIKNKVNSWSNIPLHEEIKNVFQFIIYSDIGLNKEIKKLFEIMLKISLENTINQTNIINLDQKNIHKKNNFKV